MARSRKTPAGARRRCRDDRERTVMGENEPARASASTVDTTRPAMAGAALALRSGVGRNMGTRFEPLEELTAGANPGGNSAANASAPQPPDRRLLHRAL